jgi:hypothetical protein
MMDLQVKKIISLNPLNLCAEINLRFCRTGDSSFMDLLEELDIADPPLAPVGGNGVLDDVDGERDEATGGDDDDEVVEVDVGKVKRRRAVNYTMIEDATLCRAWAAVGMDVVFGTDQTGKRYWQHIKDKFHKNHAFTTQTTLDI